MNCVLTVQAVDERDVELFQQKLTGYDNFTKLDPFQTGICLQVHRQSTGSQCTVNRQSTGILSVLLHCECLIVLLLDQEEHRACGFGRSDGRPGALLHILKPTHSPYAVNAQPTLHTDCILTLHTDCISLPAYGLCVGLSNTDCILTAC